MNLGREDERTEFKESLAQLDKGIRSLTAMLNRHGEGTVYFGVDDDGEVIGITVRDDTLSRIRERIRTYVEPMIVADIGEHLSDDGKSYIIIRSKGENTPYMLLLSKRWPTAKKTSNFINVIHRVPYQTTGF